VIHLTPVVGKGRSAALLAGAGTKKRKLNEFLAGQMDRVHIDSQGSQQELSVLREVLAVAEGQKQLLIAQLQALHLQIPGGSFP